MRRQYTHHRVTGGTGKVQVDWQVCEDEDKPTNYPPSMPDAYISAGSSARGRNLRAIAGLLLVLVATITLYLWRIAESGAHLLEDELRAAVSAEQWLAPRSRIGQTSADMPELASTLGVKEITFYGPMASVQAEISYVNPDRQTHIFQQRIFYQQTESGWVRVPPNPSYLGARQSYETASFTFFYYGLDSAAIEAVASTLDNLYVGLRQDYLLPPASERIIIEVVSEPPPHTGNCRQRNRLCIQSPALVLLPQEISEREALYLMIVSALVYQVRNVALEIGPFRHGQLMASSALPRLQMREHYDLLAAWHSDLIRWLFNMEGRTPRPDEEILAQELARLCEIHKIPALWSLISEVPSAYLCVAPAKMELYHLTQSAPIFRFGQLTMPDQELMLSESSWVQLLAFETVLDYVVIRYGRDALPGLVEGLRHHDAWSTLIPAIFEVSAEEFEQGWQAYLADTYGN